MHETVGCSTFLQPMYIPNKRNFSPLLYSIYILFLFYILFLVSNLYYLETKGFYDFLAIVFSSFNDCSAYKIRYSALMLTIFRRLCQPFAWLFLHRYLDYSYLLEFYKDVICFPDGELYFDSIGIVEFFVISLFLLSLY